MKFTAHFLQSIWAICTPFTSVRQMSFKNITSKKAVTRKWLQATPPTETDWIDIMNVQNMERITFSLSLRMDKYWQFWEKWIVFVCSLSHTV